MQADAENFLKKTNNLVQMLNGVSETYRILDWNDNVYESYRVFDHQIQNLKEGLEDNACQIEQASASVREIPEASDFFDRLEQITQE